MGGNALTIKTERKTTEQFNKIFSEISPILNELEITHSLTKHYHNKPTHGDMDILVKNDNIDKDKLIQLIQDKFNPISLSPNDKTISFDYDDFQIDFILIEKDNWEIANTWYSYDPIGNIQGKVAHKFGLKTGPNGLIFPFRGNSQTLVENIIITKDPRKIFEFLGYDYDRFLLGFDELEEIFDYLINSKYFNGETFQYENLNRIDKKRNRKRKSYNLFLEYININNIDKTYKFSEKESYIQYINDYFPESKLLEKIEILIEKDRVNKEINNKFNGKEIMKRYPDLKGKELGYMIMTFKETISNFDNFILYNNIDVIFTYFDKHLSIMKKK